MAPRNYGLVTSLDELRALCDRLLAGDGPIGFDIETGYLGEEDRDKYAVRPEVAIIAGFSITDSLDWARYVPLAHDAGGNRDNLEVARMLWPVLNTGRGVAHNALFEARHLSRWFRNLLWDDPIHGQDVRNGNGYFPIRSDTMVEAYLAADYPFFGLKPLTEILTRPGTVEPDGSPTPGHKMIEFYDLFPGVPVNKRKALRFNVLELTPQVIEYACEDALWCLYIHRHYYERVRTMGLYAVEMAIVTECLPVMEDHGVKYDWDAMWRTAEELRAFRARYNADIMDTLGEMLGEPVAVNLGSWQQVGNLLFERLGLRTTVYTAKTRDLPASQRKMSTGKVALAGLAKKHPVVQKIRDWKEQTRLLGTYLGDETKKGSPGYEKLYQYADDGMTHPNHMSAYVVTGRFAVSDPPYQQSPKTYHYDLPEARRAHDDGVDPPAGSCFKFNFRDMIVAPDGWYMLGFDLSQAELRAIAGEAQEPELLRAFAEGRDVHTLTASLMLGVPLEEVTKAQRDMGKMLNFALLYGMKAKGLADRLGIPVEEAEELFRSYFAVYSRIAAWTEQQVAYGRKHGHVWSKFGRKLPIWEYRDTRRWIQEKGDRACVNYPIQGSATGDFMKIAMVRAQRALTEHGLADRVKLVMNVHDALEFYVHRTLEPQDVIKVLQPAVIFDVPGWPAMKADWHFGKRWGSPIEIEVTDDGRFIAKGEQDYELKPSVDVDEDTGEEVEALPEVDPEIIRAALAANDFFDKPLQSITDALAPTRLIIQLDEMPDADGYERFRALLDANPGPHQITLSTPEGDLDLDLPAGTSIGSRDLAQISLLLGPARIRQSAADVDPARIFDGLTL